MERHSFNIFPEMNTDDYARLVSDIKTNGYDKSQPIYTYEGGILDGWNRQRACNELQVTPMYREFTGDKFEAIQFVMRTNKRRNLTSSQWAAIAAEADELWDVVVSRVEQERRIKQTETKTGMKYGENLSGNKLPDKNYDDNKASQKIAESFNTNRTYVSDAKKYRETNPEIFESIKRGDKSIAEVKKEEKIQKRKDEIDTIKRNIETDPQTIQGLYDVIAIDPPWAYEERGGFNSQQHDPESNRGGVDYPTMTVREISNIELPVKKDAVVFLWTTHAFLRDAFDLLDTWGLKYKATLVWDKERMGIGRTLRMQCEFCLIGVKGSPIIDGSSERDIIREARREHSRKPEAFYAMVDRMCLGVKLDYFSREQRKNWTSYGIEAEKFQAQEF
jgi:N6-adenosine-specific RNA methylase IME4